MPQTLLEVANSALLKAGSATIHSLAAEGKQAEIMSHRLRGVRDMLLRGHVWTWARKAVVLTRVASDVTPWLYYYALPADWLRTLSYSASDTFTRVSSYTLIGSRIYTDADTLKIYYIRQPATADEATQKYPDDFAEAWACYLAAEIMSALFDSADRRQQWLEQYLVLLRQARFTGAVEQADMAVTPVDQWIDARVSSNYDRDIYPLDAPPGGV